VIGVNVALGRSAVGECEAFDADTDGLVIVSELVMGIANAIAGCPNPDTHEPQHADRAERVTTGPVLGNPYYRW
jgi:hypothetical protein